MPFKRLSGKPRDLSEEEATVSVTAATIEKKNAANILKLLTNRIPLQAYQLEHLKRIRTSKSEADPGGRLEIIVCPSKDIDSVPEDVKAQLGEQRDVLAASYPPSTRAEFEGWGRHWPINYRPRHEETEGDFVSPEDCVIFNENYESLLLENSAMLSLTGQENMGAVIVNPANKKIVATSSGGFKLIAEELGWDEAARAHPLMTSAMLCIHMVSDVLQSSSTDIKRGVPIDQYLCTGLDLYIMTEPDLMSSMALVHSRIRRVVYWNNDSGEGCLGSRAEIHLIKSLNHHYEVFRYSDDDATSNTSELSSSKDGPS